MKTFNFNCTTEFDAADVILYPLKGYEYYHKISWRPEASRLSMRIFTTLGHLTGPSTAVLRAQGGCENWHRKNINLNLERSCDEMSQWIHTHFRLVPGIMLNIVLFDKRWSYISYVFCYCRRPRSPSHNNTYGSENKANFGISAPVANSNILI